jgi:hypothetical protein
MDISNWVVSALTNQSMHTGFIFSNYNHDSHLGKKLWTLGVTEKQVIILKKDIGSVQVIQLTFAKVEIL